MEIQATLPVYYNKPNIQYEQLTVTVNGNKQTQTVYTYDKFGNLIETVMRSHKIGEA